jgi:hypothetical protein
VLVKVVAVVSNPASMKSVDWIMNVIHIITYGEIQKTLFRIFACPITISSIASRVHMGTVLPSTSFVNSEIASSANSIKSLNFYSSQKLLISQGTHCKFTTLHHNTSFDWDRSFSTFSNNLKKNFNCLVTNKRSAKDPSAENNLGYITIERITQNNFTELRVMTTQ